MGMLKLKTTILSTKTKMDRNGKNEEVPLNTSINKLMRQMCNGEGRATEQSKYYKNWLCHSYIIYFMLNSAEHGIFPAHKY